MGLGGMYWGESVGELLSLSKLLFLRIHLIYIYTYIYKYKKDLTLTLPFPPDTPTYMGGVCLLGTLGTLGTLGIFGK